MRPGAKTGLRFFGVLLAAVVLAAALLAGPARASGEIRYAPGFQTETISDCTLITVKPAWRSGAPLFRYLLVPWGTTPPRNHPPAQVVRVPVRRVVALSTTYLAYLDAAGLVDRLVGLSDFKYVNTPSVRRRIEAGELLEVGNYASLRMEALLDLSPDLIITPATGTSFDVHPKLQEAGLPTAVVLDHLEADPLGRCEWINFLALFLGTGEHAEKMFREIEGRYKRLAGKAANPGRRPTVFTNTPLQGQWLVPGGDSYMARLIRDAGVDYLWSAQSGVGSLPLSIEAVIFAAQLFIFLDKVDSLRTTRRHPTVEDDVIIYAQATILGGHPVIGARSVIAGNVWLTESVPPDTKEFLKKPALICRNGQARGARAAGGR